MKNEKVILQIKKENINLIKSGSKKNEWRQSSFYNKKLLFSAREDGKLDGNKDIKFIEFINGYNKFRETLVVEVVSIRLVKFSKDIEIKEDNFKAKEGQFAIEIKLGNIIVNN